jgi:DNA-binding NarL/FixJ family response regulator
MNKQTQSPATTRYTALVADDDARVRRTLAWLLQHSQEWELVDAVADGASALQCAAERHPDLVLLDFRLPDGDGAIWIPRLCALRPPPLVVVLIEVATRAIYDQVLHL